MFQALLGIGVAGLLVVGAWSLYAGRFAVRGGRDQLLFEDVTYLTRADLEEPRRLLEPARAANLVIAALETLLLSIATITLLELWTRPGIPTWFLVASTTLVVVGGLVLGRAIYVRVGFAVPEHATDVDEFGTDFERVAGADAAADFAAIHEAMRDARGEDASDAATAAVLAAARANVETDELRAWAGETGLASPASVDDRIDTLAHAGVLDPDAFAFHDDRLADAPPSDVASLASSVPT